MHALIFDGAVQKYPYSIGNLRKDNPQTSFPRRPSDAALEEWGVYVVARVDRPEIDELTQDAKEMTPVFVNGTWTQVWEVVPASPEDVVQRKAEKNEQVKQQRAEEYKNYSDPLFFKWQRGEGLQQEWLDAVAHIKELMPYAE